MDDREYEWQDTSLHSLPLGITILCEFLMIMWTSWNLSMLEPTCWHPSQEDFHSVRRFQPQGSVGRPSVAGPGVRGVVEVLEEIEGNCTLGVPARPSQEPTRAHRQQHLDLCIQMKMPAHSCLSPEHIHQQGEHSSQDQLSKEMFALFSTLLLPDSFQPGGS